MNSRYKLLDMFDEGDATSYVCSSYKQINAKKACECKCNNQDVSELLKFATDPMFSYAKYMDDLKID